MLKPYFVDFRPRPGDPRVITWTRYHGGLPDATHAALNALAREYPRAELLSITPADEPKEMTQ